VEVDPFAARRAAKKGAMIELALSYAPELRAYIRRFAPTPWEADDLLQETMVRALTQLDGLRDSARCRAWLFRIARNVFLDQVKRRRPQPIGDDGAISERCASHTATPLRPDLERALGALPSKQRECLLLCDLWGFRYAEIARIVGAPIGTVRSRISRGRAELQLTLAAHARGRVAPVKRGRR